jgi:hypothetical protein
MGIDDELEEHDNCPDNVIVYCEDANGILYRYERLRGEDIVVKAKEDGAVENVPADAFRVEYYRQGELAEVAKNPLKNPELLQDFLDRHLSISDLKEEEEQGVATLSQNSAQLISLETLASQLKEKNAALVAINTKLLLAEEGRLKEIAGTKTRLGNEKNMATTIAEIQATYQAGISLSGFLRDYSSLASDAGALTDHATSKQLLGKIKTTIDAANVFLEKKQSELNVGLRQKATELATALVELKKLHGQLDQDLAGKVSELQKKGLSGNIAELQTLIKQKSKLSEEISRINAQKPQLIQVRKDRKNLLSALSTCRDEITTRRKAQLESINRNLAATLQDYTVFMRYEPRGIVSKFKEYILNKMQGTYFPEASAELFCGNMTPLVLSQLILDEDLDKISKQGGVDLGWAEAICKKLRFYPILHDLEVMWKAPCPVITVRTKGAKPKEIPVSQLSDGQKHTIMLTIAMLAESNIPLVIDQPEDDLDNAFIFSTVVKTLRAIKECRQVILVTHNANIAVLGDAEMLLPMKRSGEGGCAFDFGSIDKAQTRQAAVDILEGGDLAFQRRREIYGH